MKSEIVGDSTQYCQNSKTLVTGSNNPFEMQKQKVQYLLQKYASVTHSGLMFTKHIKLKIILFVTKLTMVKLTSFTYMFKHTRQIC